MADLQVDVDGLERLVTSMADVRRGLDDTRAVVAAGADALGSDELLDALEHFERHWQDGRDRVKANVEAISDAISESATAYRQADDDLAASLEAR
jgi:hypothetical protein